jgi:thymidine kinase
MNAGKSTALIQVAHNYEERGMRVAILTSNMDNRYGVGNVSSRLGVQRKADVFKSDTNVYGGLLSLKAGQPFDSTQLTADAILDAAPLTPLACVLIDEAQFLTTEQVEDLHRFTHVEGLPVVCYGIRSDFQGKAFPGSAALLTLADTIEEIKTICRCGRKATMNVRIDEDGERITHGAQIAIEGTVRYDQVCGRCFYNPPPPARP